MNLKCSNTVTLSENEIEIHAVRSQGPGGQNVNKVASAVHLRFDIRASSLPTAWKRRLLALKDQRVSSKGIVVIKAREFRTLEKNRQAALDRLKQMILTAVRVRPGRKPTKPTRASREKRLDRKIRRGRTKALRKSVRF